MFTVSDLKANAMMDIPTTGTRYTLCPLDKEGHECWEVERIKDWAIIWETPTRGFLDEHSETILFAPDMGSARAIVLHMNKRSGYGEV